MLMKRISTLAIVAFFFCLSTMAQVVLGDINFSLKEGQKISPKTGKITVTFPNVSGVADPTATNFAIAGAFNDIDFDGLEGSFASGVTLDLAEFELQPATAYVLKITSVKVSDTELAPAEGYTLNFKTRGAERKMEWTFTIDEASVAKILEDENAEGNETAGIGTYWSVITANQRHYIHQKLDHSEVMLDANTPLPMTEDLLFTINADKVYVGDVTDTKYTNSLVFNANAQQITIPDCQEGDVITFNSCKYATKPSTSKFPVIVALNGGAIAPDGLVSSSGLQDSIDVPKNATNLRFEVVVAGDVSFTIDATRLGMLGSSVNYLFAYPYGCLEQQSSKILPLIAFGEYIDVFGLNSEISNVETLVKSYLKTWGMYQLNEGGFPYWPNGDYPSLYVSLRMAYIYALALERGYKADDFGYNIDNLLNYIRKEIHNGMTGQGGDGSTIYQDILQYPVNIDYADVRDWHNIYNNADNFYTPYAQNPWWTLDNNWGDYTDDRVYGNAEFGPQII